MEYKEDDYLLLSGIQHFLFCRRQWALIHIEQQWEENYHTVDGRIMHKNAHDSGFNSFRDNVITIRALKIHSSMLGISGECDVVEFHPDENGITLAKANGLWKPYPIEYKRGQSKEDIYDHAQLCAQAMCLEEMLCCKVEEGAMYYGKTRRREIVTFGSELRSKVCTAIEEMHELFSKGYTPKVKVSRKCDICSLKDICHAGLKSTKTVEEYLREFI